MPNDQSWVRTERAFIGATEAGSGRTVWIRGDAVATVCELEDGTSRLGMISGDWFITLQHPAEEVIKALHPAVNYKRG